MGNTPTNIVQSLYDVESYQSLFKQAFPEQKETISVQNIITSLAAFQSSLVSLNSRYDQYAHGYLGN